MQLIIPWPLVLIVLWGTASAAPSDNVADSSSIVRPKANNLVTTRAGRIGSPVEITDVQIGFGGFFKVGNWFPVAVTLQAADQPVSGRLSVITPDSTGAACQYVQTGASDIQIEAGQSVVATAYARSGRVHGSMQVTFTTDDGMRVTRTLDRDQLPAALLTSQRLIVGIGPPIGCRDALVRHPQPEDDRAFVARIDDVRWLPDQSFGYAGVDVIVLATSDLNILERLSKTQWQAIEEWVRLGGRLILTMGDHGERLLTAGHPLVELVPGTFSRVSLLRETGGLESYAKSSRRLDLLFREMEAVETGPRATVLNSVDGVVEAYEGRGPKRIPLVVHGPHGFGRVVFVAIDLDRPPMDRWPGQVPLAGRLLELTLGPFLESDDEDAHQTMAHVGYEDLTGQLRMALDQFSDVRRLPFLAIAALATLYILLIGPGDYFFVRKVLHRAQGTWVTFPLLVLLFGGVALWLTRQRDHEPLQMNQLGIVDLDSTTGTCRGSDWSHLYSRDAAKWNVGLRIGKELVSQAGGRQGRGGVLVSWQGLPGTGFGGMNQTQHKSNSWQAYSIVGRGFKEHRWIKTQIESLPMSRGSTRSLFGRWWDRIPATINPSLDAAADETLSGTVTNPWSVTLQETWLVHGRWYYPLGDLAPGQTKDITQETNPRSLKSRLARRKIIDSKDVSTPWDDESSDVPRLVEMLMFHDAVGGRDYTSLRHRHQADLDLSSQLTVGRAILIGQSDEQATQWVCQLDASGAANQRDSPVPTADEESMNRKPVNGDRDTSRVASEKPSYRFFRVLLPVNRYQRDRSS